MKTLKIYTFITMFMLYALTFAMEPLRVESIYIRNISLFIIIGIFAYGVINQIAKFTIESMNLKGIKETLVYSLKVLVFATILLLTSTLQINFMQYKNIPISKGCSFYDEYENPIYENQFNTGCANIDYILKTEDYLEFNVEESYSYISRIPFRFDQEDNQSYENVLLNNKVLTTTKITYDDEHRILESEVIRTYVHSVDADVRGSSFYSTVHTITKNTYGEKFEQVIQKGYVVFDSNESDSYTLEHADLSNVEYSTIRYYQVDLSGNSYEIYKEYTKDDELVTDLYVTVTEERDSYTIREVNSIVDRVVATKYTIEGEKVLVGNANEFEDELTKISKMYSLHNEYGMIITDARSYIGINEFNFISTSNRNYYVQKFEYTYTNSTYTHYFYYEFHETDNGLYLEVLDFNDISLYDYLFNKDYYDEYYNQPGYFKGSYLNQEATSIFDISYEFEDLIYTEPIYID
ncbi:MAG: hypothetical protein KQ78_02221 [Candidatus Izimaplasma bacterium HR2]|nr:MAG: hypothetical protein KQ78_02221 [Candidatus Izimaplasma bacterium HR2]